MADNVYRVLMGDNAPFMGMANVNYFDRTLKGEIVNVHYEPMKETVDGPILNQVHYRTVDIRWLEGKPYTSLNVHIPELISLKGGYGLNYLPTIGDIVLASFDSTNQPNIISIVSRCSAYNHGALSDETLKPVLNKYGDVIIDNVVEQAIRPTPFRFIEPGEISLTSLNNNSEIYLDKNGATKIITRIPNTNLTGGVQCGNRLWEIAVGQDIIDEGTQEIKKSSFGNNIQFQVLGHQNDCKVDFDSEGNIEVKNKGHNVKIETNGNFTINTTTGNKVSLTDGVIKISDKNGNSITMNSSGIHLGDNANFSAVLGESLNTLLESMIMIFNAHTHMYSPGSGSPTPTATTLTPMTIADILSKTIKLKQ